jgi:hypothetical protein
VFVRLLRRFSHLAFFNFNSRRLGGLCARDSILSIDDSLFDSCLVGETLQFLSFAAYYNIRSCQRWPSVWMQQLDKNSVTIKSSILAAKTINHDVYLNALYGDKSSVPVVRVDSDISFEEPSISNTLFDLLFNLKIFLEVDSFLRLFVFVFFPRLFAFPVFEPFAILTIIETLLLTNTFLNFF